MGHVTIDNLEVARIKNRLERDERTAAWLGRQIGMSRNYVATVLRGQYPASERFLLLSADVLGLRLRARRKGA